jgi:hypothetical protein
MHHFSFISKVSHAVDDSNNLLCLTTTATKIKNGDSSTNSPKNIDTGFKKAELKIASR